MLFFNKSIANILYNLIYVSTISIALITSSPSTCFAEPPITIGVSLGLTGKYSTMAKLQEKSYQLWALETNRSGGILGRKVQLEVVDDQSSPQKALAAYNQFIYQDKVDLLFAPFSSEITKAIIPVAEKNNYPLIAAGAASDSLWQEGHNNIFGVFTPASKITVSFLEMLVMKGIDNLAILYAQDPFSQDIAKGCRKWAQRFGLTVKHIEPFAKKSADYSALTANAIQSGSDVVIMCGHLNEAVSMKQAIDNAGWKPRAYYSSQGPNQKFFRDKLQDSANYVFGTEQWEYLGGITTEETQKFIALFNETYGMAPPNYFAVTAFSAGQILAKAIKEARSLDRKTIRDTIASLDFNCLLGRFKVDQDGRPTKSYTLVFQLQNLTAEVVWPQSLRTAEPIF